MEEGTSVPSIMPRRYEPRALKHGVLPDPRERRSDDWARKIETAKQAREAGRAIRVGKSPVVPDPKLTSR